MNEKRNRETGERQSARELSGFSGGTRQTSPETILSAVTNDHRRAVLNALINASDMTLEYDALVDYVADYVQNENPKRVSEDHRQRVRIALRHSHLPKLEETRIIDYEVQTGDVQFVGGEREREILSMVESYDTRGSATHD